MTPYQFKRQGQLINHFFGAIKPRKRIEVKVIPSEYPLGTTDGEHYTVVPRG